MTLVTLYKPQKEVKFIYSEKATKFCQIFPLLLSYVVPVKSKGKISQNFVAFSEYMNFKNVENPATLRKQNDQCVKNHEHETMQIGKVIFLSKL